MVCKFASRRTALAMALLLMLASLCVVPTMAAQAVVPQVVSSYAVPLGETNWTSTQIWKIIMSSKGDVIAWDGQSNALYQFPADGSGIKVLVPPPPDIFGNGQWETGGIAFDAEDNLYYACRWDGYLLKIPYDPEQKTWNVVISDSTKWGNNGGPSSIGGWVSPIDVNYSPANVKGNGHFIISDENQRVVFQYNGSGNGKYIVGGLKNRAFKTAVDRGGNVYFLQDMGQGGVPGVFRIPAGVYEVKGDNKGTMEAGWPVCGTPESMPTALDPDYTAQKVPLQKPCRVDNGLGTGLIGLTVDADGNVFISDQDDAFNTDPNNTMSGGIFKVSLETFDVVINGEHFAVTMPNAANMMLVAPVPAQGSPLVDPKGNLYVPLWSTGWNGINNITKVFLGSAALAASPLNQEGATSQVMYSFNSSVKPDQFTFSQVGEAQDFALVPGDGTCAAGTTYAKYQRCNVNVALKPQVVGPTSGQLSMQAGGVTVAKTYVHGQGQGAGISVLSPAAEIPLRSGLQGPKQVATDRSGNFYIADAASGKVLRYLPGSTEATQPTTAGSFTAPTGVAVDGAGNIFVADSGKVIQVPASGGEQFEVQIGLGTNLSLAADGAGNVYVADPDNHRVIKIPNPDSRKLTGNSVPTMGSGFTAPTAVAADDDGNLFVVDGATLTQVFVSGGQTPITNELNAPTGVALDASGAIYVAQAGGVIRIPKVAGGYDFTSKTTIGLNVSIPSGVAVDASGTVYISDGETPGVVAVANGAVDFGFVTMGKTAKQTVTFLNVGNQPLTFTSPMYTSNGPNTTDFAVPDASNACLTASVESGATCTMDTFMTPVTSIGSLVDRGTVHSNAFNSVSLELLGVGSNSADSEVTISYLPANPIYPGDVTVSVTVAPASGEGVPTGKVVLSVDGQPTKPVVLQDGVAEFTLRRPNGGTHTLIAAYQGDMNYAATTATAAMTIGRAASTIVLTPPVQDANVPGTFVQYQRGDQFTARVTSPVGAPTGMVVFKEGATQLGTGIVDANGYTSFNTGTLALGSHTLTATYTGDSNFNGSDSATITLQVIRPSVYISAQPANLTLTGGVAGEATLTLRSVVDFKGTIQMSCGNLPQYSQCTFDWPTTTMKVGEAQNVKVTISTNVPVNVASNHATGNPGAGFWWPTATFAIGVVGLVIGKKTKYSGRVLVLICGLLIVSSAVVGLTACGGDSYTKTPPAPHVTTPTGTTVVTITASSGGQVVSLPFTLSVTVK